MTRIGPGYDWGRRSSRWAGITSEVVDVGGIRVHYLRAGAGGEGSTHLLIHSMGSGAWSWMDVISPLSARGLVIAPDLPGSGRSRPIHRGAGDIFADAQFVDDFTAALGIERMVVHGHSMGGLVAGLFAARVPDRVERLVLTSAPLPGLPDPPRYPGAWRVALAVARPVADVLVGAGVRLKGDAWRRWADGRDSAGLASAMARGGTDASRISPDLLSLAAEELGRLALRWRVEGAVDAALSVVRALTVDEAKVRAGLDAIRAPTLLLWGADDRVIPQRLIDEVEAAHPEWDSRTLEDIGHLLPWESPESYVELAGCPPQRSRGRAFGALRKGLVPPRSGRYRDLSGAVHVGSGGGQEMRRLLPLLSAALIIGATAATVSAQGKDWGDVPPHGHVMLLGAEIGETNLFFDHCVEFAAGQALPKAAHHESVHTGAAGGSPFAQGALWAAGHVVIPLAPFVPFDWTGCESFESGMALPG